MFQKKIYIAFYLLFMSLVVVGQGKRKASVDNIDLHVQNKKIIVSYDLIRTKPDQKYSIDLFFIDINYNYIVPNSLKGDVGKSVLGGINKKIVWNLPNDYDYLDFEISPTISLNGNLGVDIDGGAINALYSLLVPGLGDYFVADHKQMKFKPYYRTALSLGLIALGVYAKNQRYTETIVVYSKGTYDYRSGTYFPGDEKWISGETFYWLFESDAELFIASGIGVWLFDVIWVFAKGQKNEQRKSYLDGRVHKDLDVSSNLNGINLKYTITF